MPASARRAQDRSERPPAAATFGAGAARFGDVFGRRRSSCHGISHHLTGDAVTQADEHRVSRLLVDPQHVDKASHEDRRIRTHSGSGDPGSRGVGLCDPASSCLVVVEFLQDHHFVSVVKRVI